MAAIATYVAVMTEIACLLAVLSDAKTGRAPSMSYKKSCRNKPDGRYTLPDVFKYADCRHHRTTILNCPDGKFFHAVYRYCSAAKPGDQDTFCTSRPDGMYQNPWNCKGFIHCYQEKKMNGWCGQGTRFCPDTEQCQWERNVPCIQLP